jgi:proline iminopeptidase
MRNNRLKTFIEGILGAIVIGFTILLSPVLRGWYRRWGASEAEFDRTLPGDEFVPRPKSQIHCAIDIEASPGQVWPWFVQLGCQRGGWYSYDLLDNGGVPSAESILPEFQHLEVGEVVKAVPNGSFGFPVAAIDSGVALVLAGTLDTTTGKPADPNDPALSVYFSGDQTFYLESLEDGKTRLTFRMRIDWNSTTMNNLAYRGIVEPVSFVMGRKMLLNIRRRAERAQPMIK